MKKKIFIKISVLFVLFFSCALHSQNDTLSLKKLLFIGLENNFDIKILNKELVIFDSQILSNKGRFEPFWKNSLSLISGDDPTLTYSKFYDFQSVFVLPTSWGIDFDLGADLQHFYNLQAKNFFNISGAFVGLNMPLFKGLGPNSVNNIEFEKALLNYESKKISFNQNVRSYVYQVIQNYIIVLNYYNILKFNQKRLENVSKFQNDISLMAEKEEIPKSEVIRANAFKNNNSIALINSQKDFNTALKNLYNLINRDTKINENNSNTDLIEDIPEFSSFEPYTYFDKVKNKLENIIDDGLDFQAILKDIQISNLELNGAENRLKPDINLGVQLNYFGFNNKEQINEVFNAFSSTYPGTSVKLDLKYVLPFGNALNEGFYAQKKAELELNLLSKDKFKTNRKHEIESIIINTEYSIDLFDDIENNADLFYKTYLNEVEKFKLGNATQIDVMNSFDDYVAQQINFENIKLSITSNFIKLRYLLSDLPYNTDMVNDFDLWDLKIFK